MNETRVRHMAEPASPGSFRLRTLVLLGALMPLMGWPAGAASQGATQDSRWLPWIGCWEGAAVEGETAQPESNVVCFRYDPSGGIDISTYAEGAFVSSETLRADGTPITVEESGCAGTRVADWSADGSMVVLTSDMTCGSALGRTTRGVLASVPERGGWIEIQAVGSDEARPVLGIRSFVPASSELLDELGLVDPTAGIGLAVSTARARGPRPLTSDGIAELVERVGPEVTSALILERGQTFELDASMLRALSNRGVPGEVIDVMVAVTYPERFQLAGPEENRPEFRESAPARTAQRTAPYDRNVRVRVGYSPWGFGYYGYYDPFWYPYSYYDDYYYGYGRYPYGGGFYYRYGSPFVPGVIVVSPPTVERARLDPERGLVPPGSPSGGTATPKQQSAPASSRSSSSSSSGGSSRPSTTSSSSRPSATSSSSRPSGGSSGSTARPSGSSSSGSGSSGQTRRAVPRPG